MLTNAAYADIFRPTAKVKAVIYDVVLIVSGSLVIALSAQVAIGWPVPITAQTFAVLMIAALLGSKRATISVLTYIVEGLVGLPVFAHGKVGLAALSSPTGGYIIGFVAAAYVVGLLAEHGWDRKITTTIFAMTLGNICIYAFGLGWLFILVSLGKQTFIQSILAVGLYPFIFGDLIKIALAAALLPAGWKLLNKINHANSGMNQ